MPTEVTIQGHLFTIDTPYVEGHALKANEASALNNLLAENIRNNQANLVRAAKEKALGVESGKATKEQLDSVTLDEATIADLQGQINQYVTNYEFGVRAGGGRSKDPLQREIENMAIVILENALKSNNISPSKLKKDDNAKYEAALSKVIEARRDELTKEAKRRIGATQKLGDLGIDGILGGGDSSASE